MRTLTILALAAISISLSACSSMRGNVVPQTGPGMEQIYDSMGEQRTADSSINSDPVDLNKLRQQKYTATATAFNSPSVLPSAISVGAVSQEFHKLPDPELKAYIYPHLVGADQVPIPGYYTAFNVYEHDYYALPQE